MINQSCIDDREKYHRYEIKKIKYTIEELCKLKSEKYKELAIAHSTNLHSTCCDMLLYPMQYYKYSISSSALESEICEIEKILIIEHEKLKKEKEYLNNILIQQKPLDEYDDHF